VTFVGMESCLCFSGCESKFSNDCR